MECALCVVEALSQGPPAAATTQDISNKGRSFEMAQIATISKVDNGFIVDRSGCSHTQESLVIADDWAGVLYELTKHYFKLDDDYDLSQLRLSLENITPDTED